MGNIKNFLDKDFGWNAAILSILIPLFTYFILDIILQTLIRYVWYQLHFMDHSLLMLIGIFMNLLVLRKYIRGEEYPLNGRVVLALTFTMAIVYFIIAWI